jgi:twitching motility protein PilT
MDLAQICKAATELGASDIHLKSGKPPLIRIDGLLRPLPNTTVLTSEAVGKLAWGLLNPTQRERFKKSPDIDIGYAVSGSGRFRVNVYRQRQQIGLALRAIPNRVPTLGELELPRALRRIALEPRGLVLLTGVTGSGKSTTMAAMIEEINTELPHHILTIEDPIEFYFEDKQALINQREIGSDSQDFPKAMRAALRQDPDVIMVSEIRDKLTMEIALSAAETGHLVLGSLHSLNAGEAITRIVDFFDLGHQQPIRHLLAGSLGAIVSQRLVPGIKGGRVAAVEIMMNTGALTDCITRPERTREIPDLLAKGTSQYGTQTFDQSLFWAWEDGLISEENACRYATNTEDLALRISGISTGEWVRPA